MIAILSTGYEIIYTITLLRNFAHDKDLILMLDKLRTNLERQDGMVEHEAQKFMIKTPLKPPKDVRITNVIEEFSDRFIYRQVFRRVEDDLFRINRAVRTCVTNDRIRSLFTDFALGQMQYYDDLLKYGKMKDWHDVPPSYKTATPQKKEPLIIAGAFHLWDHVNQRYDHHQLTTFYLTYTHDLDFQAILALGRKNLEGEITDLEKLSSLCRNDRLPRPPVL